MTDIVERMLAYAKVWGKEPSIPPFPDTSPGFTTGMVIGDANEAAEEIKRLRAALDDPFRHADALDWNYIDDLLSSQSSGSARFWRQVLRDCYAARKALKGEP
jgi:hypothetical protein